MIAKLEGPTFGPYRCSNCKMLQPQENMRANCIFCGNWFSNYEETLIEEDAERFFLHIKGSEKQNESNLPGRN